MSAPDSLDIHGIRVVPDTWGTVDDNTYIVGNNRAYAFCLRADNPTQIAFAEKIRNGSGGKTCGVTPLRILFCRKKEVNSINPFIFFRK